MANPDAILGHVIDQYAAAIATARYADLPALQQPPHANLAHGGGGTAYALWRVAGERARPDLGRLARGWLESAIADRTRTRLMFDRPADRRSYLFGTAGLHWLDARMRRGERRLRSRDAFVTACRRGGEAIEMMEGAAGHLLAGSLLTSTLTSKQRLVFDAIADRLETRWQRRARRPWRAIDATNTAHGWPGIAYALLSWAQCAGGRASDSFIASLRQLAVVWSPTTIPQHHMRASWCMGAAGIAMLWAKAFAVTSERVFLRHARECGRAAKALLEPSRTHLCCGMAGVAYALLALDRVDPSHGWRKMAVDVGVRAVQTPLQSRWPNGLLWGHPGLVCLALDLMADEPKGFPLIEA